MVIANDHYQSIGIVCLSVITERSNVSCISGQSTLFNMHEFFPFHRGVSFLSDCLDYILVSQLKLIR